MALCRQDKCAGTDAGQQSESETKQGYGRLAHFNQTRNGAGGVVGMQGRQEHVSGQSCPNTEFRCFFIANFAYKNDIRILAQKGTQSSSKCQPGFCD